MWEQIIYGMIGTVITMLLVAVANRVSAKVTRRSLLRWLGIASVQEVQLADAEAKTAAMGLGVLEGEVKEIRREVGSLAKNQARLIEQDIKRIQSQLPTLPGD